MNVLESKIFKSVRNLVENYVFNNYISHHLDLNAAKTVQKVNLLFNLNVFDCFVSLFLFSSLEQNEGI